MGKRVLIVEDEKDVRDVVCDILEAEGFECTGVGGGKAAIKSVKKDPPDIILLDIMMPEMDGLETAHEIRKFSQVPIIVVTVKDDDTTMKMARKLYGVEYYITKPFKNDKLVNSVKKTLNIK